MPRDADELLALLDLEKLDDDLFRGNQMPTTRPMVFGGQIAAQSLVAASLTVEEPYVAHSLHSYFLQPGDPSTPTMMGDALRPYPVFCAASTNATHLRLPARSPAHTIPFANTA